MKNVIFTIFVCLLITSLYAQDAAQMYMGMPTEKPIPQSVNVQSLRQIMPATDNASRVGTLIDFDYYDSPVSFGMTNPLHVYGGFGLVFMGPTNTEGGAILDEGSNFGVTGYSPPNYLAFNNSSAYPSGHPPAGPETITFYQPVSYVEVKVGSIFAETIRMEAYHKEGYLLDAVDITGTDVMQTISVTAEEIWKVVISYTGDAMIIDDLYYDTYLAPDNLSLSFNNFTGEAQLLWKYAAINGMFDDFSDYEAQNWIPITGGWSVNAFQEYQVYTPDFFQASSFYNYDFTDFSLEFVGAKTAGDDNYIGAAFGGDPYSIGLNGLWDNGYLFMLTQNGQWSVIRADAGIYTVLKAWGLGTGVNTGLGSLNEVRIIVSGGNMTFFINDINQGSIYDATYLSGKIGLTLYDDNYAGQGIFEYVSVAPPIDGYTFPMNYITEDRPVYAADIPLNEIASAEPIAWETAPLPPELPFVYRDKGTFENFRVYRNGDYIVGSPTSIAYTDQQSEFGVYDYSVQAKYNDGESMPTNHQICWWSEFPVVKQTPSAPDETWDAFLSDLNAPDSPKMYDEFSGITELISGIEFLGFSTDNLGIPHAGEDPMEFEINFYVNDGGQPGADYMSFTASLERIETSINYNEELGFYSYLYRYNFPDPVDLSDGWVSVSGTGLSSPDCLFWWLDSPDGDQSSWYWHSNSWNHIPHDMAFTLQGGWMPPEPFNLEATLDDDNGVADLSWDYPPAGKAFQYFKIYRDGAELGIASTNNYTNNLPVHGNYEYYVTAYFDEGESVPSNTVNVNWGDFGLPEGEEQQLLVYPNPVRNALYIESQSVLNEAALFNYYGQEVYHSEVSDLKFEINTSAFPPGVYFLRLHMEDGYAYRKIVIGR